jgi:DNA/RNA endonuclease YhcR with UshA esterase domain
MKPLNTVALALCLAAALQGRAAETTTPALTIGAAQASDYIGKQVTVTGVVIQVKAIPNITFLNFDKPFPNSPFTAIIRGKSTNEFENLTALKGKAVSVKGKVIEYNGKPEIELNSKSQLKLLSDTK